MTNPTIVLFARAPVPGHCKTRLAKGIGEVGAARLYEAMLLDTIARVSAIEDVRRVLFVTPENDGRRVLAALAPDGWELLEQVQGSLTDRLVQAFETYGDDYVACLGSDAPLAPLWFLENALKRGREDVIVGPTRDGGYWTIGMRRLVRELLDDMPWSTNRVTSETLSRAARLGLTLTKLPLGFDVDELDDLPVMAQALAKEPGLAPRTAAWFATSSRT